MTIPEIAEALEISPLSADRHWRFARAWLKWAIRGKQAVISTQTGTRL